VLRRRRRRSPALLGLLVAQRTPRRRLAMVATSRAHKRCKEEAVDFYLLRDLASLSVV